MKATKETKWLQDLLRELEVSYNSHVPIYCNFENYMKESPKNRCTIARWNTLPFTCSMCSILQKKEEYKFSKSHLLNNQQIMFWVLNYVLEKSKFIHYKHLMWLKSLEGNNNQEITKKSRTYLMETNNLSCVPSTQCIFRGPIFVIFVISICLPLPA